MSEKHYEVVIVGGGISGAALFFELAKYSDINNICLLEKYDDLANLTLKVQVTLKQYMLEILKQTILLIKQKLQKGTGKDD